MLQENLQHRNFVNPQRDVRLMVKMSADQANAAMRLILARWPELADLRSAGQLQSINSAGQFRIAAVRGGTFPASVTTADVEHLVRSVLDESPAMYDGRLEYGQSKQARRVR